MLSNRNLRILADPDEKAGPGTAQAGRSRRRWLPTALALVLLAGTGLAAFGTVRDSPSDDEPARLVSVPLRVPEFAGGSQEGPWWREERVQRGDTIGSLLARSGVADADALAWLRTAPAARPLYQLRIGRPVHVATDDEGRLAALKFLSGPSELLTVSRVGDEFFASVDPARVDIREALATGEIVSSLFAATDAAGLPDAVTLALAEIFGGEIDFLRDLRRGDTFAVVYEARSIEGEPAGIGRVIAAEFVNRGEVHRAFLWRHPDGTESYYGEDGRPNRKAFLRTPVEFSRMTSGYSLARFHPILQTWRAHRGVDYAAPLGTPVRATADGKVVFTGSQNGYGNVVVLQHHGPYSTLYAHLAGFQPRLRQGASVTQGDTIGYVGTTGWATGPHLHYEFRISGEPRDPLNVALPNALPLPDGHRAGLAQQVKALLSELALAREIGAMRMAASR